MKQTQARAKSRRSTALLLPALLVLAAAAWYLFLRPAPAPPPALLHPTPPQVAQTEKRLNTLGQAATRPGTKPRTLRVSENDLNVYLAGSPSARRLLAARGVQAVQIVLMEPAGVVIHAAVRIQKHAQNIEVDGALTPDPKLGVRFTASHAQVGRFPLPAPVVTAEANALAAHFSRQVFQRLSVSVESVSVQKKDLVIVALPLRRATLQSVSPDHH